MDKTQTMSLMNCSLDDNLSLDKTELANFTSEMSPDVTGITVDNTGGNTTLAWDNNSSNGSVQDYDGNYFYDGGNYTCWDYWQNNYYPRVIRESYPVYIQERAQDKGKKAFEIIKILKDKKLVQLKTVGNFVDLMDELIKIL